MPSFLASLVFVAAAIVAAAAIFATWTRYRDVALGHVAALRGLEESRDFRVRIVTQGRLPAFTGHPGIRRLPHRAAAVRRAVNQPGVRVAA